jgi:archaellum component FlaC
VHEVYRKQAGRIEELERENKRLEKEVEDVTGRFKKTEDQLEDLREASVDVAELRERLRVAEGKVGGVEELVCFIHLSLFLFYTGLRIMG